MEGDVKRAKERASARHRVLSAAAFVGLSKPWRLEGAGVIEITTDAHRRITLLGQAATTARAPGKVQRCNRSTDSAVRQDGQLAVRSRRLIISETLRVGPRLFD